MPVAAAIANAEAASSTGGLRDSREHELACGGLAVPRIIMILIWAAGMNADQTSRHSSPDSTLSRLV